MENKNCINCSTELSGAYCSTCGQRGEIERITTTSLFRNYIGRIFGFDTKFLRTIKDLTLSPGIVGRTFIEGNRVRYIDPVGYFFILTTLMLLSFSLLDVDIKEFMFSNSGQFSQQEAPDERKQKLTQSFLQIMSENMRVLGFLMIPFISLAAKMLYRKSGLNFLEHTTHAFYVQGHTTILSILSVILYKITSINVNMYIVALFLPFFAWAAMQFYQKKGFWQWLKGIFFYVLSYVFFMIGFMIIGGALFFLYVKFVNPNFLE